MTMKKKVSKINPVTSISQTNPSPPKARMSTSTEIRALMVTTHHPAPFTNSHLFIANRFFTMPASHKVIDNAQE
jgi:hypothetical protein